MRTAELTVVPIAWTRVDLLEMYHATVGDWELDPDEHVTDGEALVEFAGRACYQSWLKPNPATASNEGYIRHILEVGHYSVLEHGSVTFYLTGVSRSFTHELVRHRHFSYSQLSQRYVPGGETPTVVPPLFAGDPVALELLGKHQAATDGAYASLVDRADDLLSGRELSKTARKKQARQAARAVLPNAAETKIVVTGNYRAWRHFVQMRASEHADVEIRAVAVLILRALQEVAPHVFADFALSELPDGSMTASSPFVDQS